MTGRPGGGGTTSAYSGHQASGHWVQVFGLVGLGLGFPVPCQAGPLVTTDVPDTGRSLFEGRGGCRAHLLLQTDAELLCGQRWPRWWRLGRRGPPAMVQASELLVIPGTGQR